MAIDITGRDIQPGMTIAYARREGNVAKLVRYDVLAVDGDKVKVKPFGLTIFRASQLCMTAEQGIILQESAQ